MKNVRFLSLFLVLGTAAAAYPSEPEPMARLVAISGAAHVVRAANELAVYPDLPLVRDDMITTRDGRALVRFADGSLLRIAPDSRLTISETSGQRSIQLFAGKLWAMITRLQERSTNFRSGSTIAAVRGTELSIAFAAGTTEVAVLEGSVTAESAGQSQAIEGGQGASVEEGKAPVLRLEARPRDAVRWALYFPPVMASPSGSSKLAESVGYSRTGDLQKALASLSDLSEGEVRDAQLFTYRASLLLAVGRVGEAEADLARALELAPESPDALALQCVIAVADDRKEQALALGRRAVAAGPGSAAALIALSYAQQAGFNLASARASLETAVKADPANGLAWARLSELHAAHADLGAALAAARKAVELEPHLARPRTVLGFAYLAQVRTAEARESFTQAMARDAGDPLPRLGLGLARIREGALAEGTREIEVAAGLDPGNSLVRSYLGKARYEQKDGKRAVREYEMAKNLDPQDPTPWFYSAIDKQTSNRPVEALADIEQAIARNQNRAVYRSRLLLDSDLAARSASLGRIYGDLGFQSLALVEGWHSVNLDPSNYSAHRLLADSYAAQPRHEIARVSELLQSQLLQPANLTPIQPALGESNLFLISAQGPSALAFNEFNSLFNRDRASLQASALLGEHDTWSGEVIGSGIYRKVSASAGYRRFKSQGFRVNEEQDDEIATGFAQVELSDKTSVQGEVRYRDGENGDLELRFFENELKPRLTEESDGTTVRAGLKHAFSPASVLLASYIHQGKTIRFTSGHDPLATILSFDLDRDESANSIEGQYLYRWQDRDGGQDGRGWLRGLNLTGGLGYFRIDSDQFTTIVFEPLPPAEGEEEAPPDVLEFPGMIDIEHFNLYAYSSLLLGTKAAVTLAASVDRFEEEGGVGERHQINPKAGLTLNPWPHTTVRAAVFRALKRTLVTDQTLEPTQVAGFNQFYDDASGTESWVYGGALDQKIGRRAFAGVELTRRDLTIPRDVLSDDGQTLFFEHRGDEHLGRAYLLAAPHDWLALSAEYRYEKLDRPAELGLQFQEVTSHWIPLGVQLFHPSGLGASFRATYLEQEGTFRDPFAEYLPGSKDFWVLDAAVRYRLPRRHGFVSIGVRNFTDEQATYQATDSRNPAARPGRAAFASLTVAIP